MLFSSSVFLFVFLPLVLAGYYLLCPLFGRWRRKIQNLFLLCASLFFYAWGEPWFVIAMLASIGANYLFGLWVGVRKKAGRGVRLTVVLSVASNLGLLFVFKYLTFTLTQLGHLGLSLTIPVIELPIGISFFTFQAMSYVLDVARDHAPVQPSPFKLGLYISFFPQLIAGPIVKYETIAGEIDGRVETWADFSSGVGRFLVGLAKKVLLSNQLAAVADAAFDKGPDSMLFAWVGSICYLLQLYFDFGGYSDMAIGLGRMFGFHFLENFRYPFCAHSVSEYWRRWHISMTTWFRDYVYIPLGGNRHGAKKTLRNTFVVWLFTGIWHGANWTFLVWGLMNFGFMLWEKQWGHPEKWKPFWSWLYTFTAAVLVFTVFRADSLTAAASYFQVLFHLGDVPLWSDNVALYLREYGLFILMAALASAPTATAVRSWLEQKAVRPVQWGWSAAGVAALLVCFGAAVCFIIKGTYNPFIYFNF